MLEKITKRTVDSVKPGERDTFIWDTETKGFGLKVTPAGQKIFVFQYRWPGMRGPERVTIARFGDLTTDEARSEAEKFRGDLCRNVRPREHKKRIAEAERTSLTVSQLCDRYLQEGCAHKKGSTLATDKGRIERHVKPLLGKMAVRNVSKADVSRFLTDVTKGKTRATEKTKPRGVARVRGGKGTASRTVGLLGAIFQFAVADGVRPDNPVRGVQRPPDRKCERFLTTEELGQLGTTLAAEEKAGEHPVALAAIRFLALSGCRRGEALNLRWDEIDFKNACLRLKDSKTGEKVVPLGAPALQVLADQKRIEDCPYVFFGRGGEGHLIGIQHIWERVREKAGIPDVRLHDLRHSFASLAASSGLGLPMIGKMLGHSDSKTTQRYTHFAKDPVRAAADRVSRRMAEGMTGAKAGMRNATLPR